MISRKQILKNNEYENEILELINTQIRNDESSLTQSDLQAVIASLVIKIQKGKA